MKRIFVFIGCCIVSLAVYAQEGFIFTHYSKADGLSDNYITDLSEDTRGVIWIATSHGINAFNGSRFSTYFKEDSLHSVIPRNDWLCSYVDKSSRIWFGGFNGSILSFEHAMGTFRNVSLNHITLQEYPIFRGFYQNNFSELYGLSAHGIYRFSQHSLRFHKAFREIDELQQESVLTMFIDGYNNFWMGTENKGLLHISADSTIVQSFSVDNNGRTQNRVRAILPVSDSVFFIGTSRGVYSVLYADSGVIAITPKFPELREVFISSFAQDLEGNIWIGTNYSGLWVYTNQGVLKRMQTYQTGGVPIATVNSILCDSNGRVWVATQGNGLFLYNPKQSRVYRTGVESGLLNTVVSAAERDVFGNLWVGTDGGGITVFNASMDVVRTITQETGLPSNSIMTLLAQDENMWAGTWGGGIMKINMKTFSVKRFNRNNSEIPSDFVKALCFIHPDTLIVGCHDAGLSVLTLTNYNFSLPNFRFPEFFPHEQQFINQILLDAHGTLWVATIRNLFCVKNSVVIDVLENDSHFFPHLPLFVHSISASPDGSMLAGTSKGAFVIDPISLEVTNAAQIIPELYDSDVRIVYADADTNYWFATTSGLFYLKKHHDYKKIMLSKTSQGVFFFDRAVFQDPSGKMYFGTNEGLFSFYPNELTYTHSILGIYFSDLFLSFQKQFPGTDILPNHLSNMQKIILRAEHVIWGVSFNVVCFDSPESVEFAYMLEGFDADWNMIGSKQEITFTNIPPGTYVLHIKAWQFNPDDAVIQSLTVKILPPWWKTWWFHVVIILAVLLIVYALYTVRLYSLQKQKVLLKREVTQQTRILEEQKKHIEEQHQELMFVSRKLQESNEILHSQKEELEDITKQLQEDSQELAELNKTLKQLNETNNQLFSLIAHDVKNSFYSIRGLSDALYADFAELAESQRLRIVSLISKATHHTADLLENLLHWSKNQSTTIECSPDYFDLNEIITYVIESYKHAASEKNIVTHFASKQIPHIYADREMIITVIRNIYNNALKYTPEGGIVVISVQGNKQFAEIQIKDSGIGIDDEMLMSLMESQTDIVRKNRPEIHGSGLGLLVSKQFVEKNKGSIQVEKNSHKGTIFRIKIPLAPHNEESQIISGIQEGSRISFKENSFCIAIIEDNPAILRLFRDFLEQDFICVLFSSVNDFTEAVKRETFDLVISDIMMPGIDGFSLCQLLKEDEKTAHIPIVLISSKHDDEVKRQAYEHGADAFLQKPVSKPVLLALVQKLLLEKEKKNHTILSSPSKEHAQDAQFMKRFEDHIKQNISNADFSIEHMAEDMNMSRTQLFRKVKHMYTISPKDYLVKVRMHAAAELLQYDNARVTEIAYAVGFSDPSYFTRCFVKHYGVTPTEYRDSLQKN